MNPYLWQDNRLVNSKLTGDTSQLRGDASGVTGNVAALRGDVTGLVGALDGVRGDIDACGLLPADRQAGVQVTSLLSPNSAQIAAGNLTAGQLETALGQPDTSDAGAGQGQAGQAGQANLSTPP